MIYLYLLHTMVFIYTKNTAGHFTCRDCVFTTPNQSTMHYHLRNHDGTLTHECKHCDMKFLQKSILDLHIKSRHETTKNTFSCPCCDYTDLRKGNCVIHFARIHLKKDTDALKGKPTLPATVAQCTKCTKSFKNMTGFYYHVSNCVQIEKSHPLSEQWKKVTT